MKTFDLESVYIRIRINVQKAASKFVKSRIKKQKIRRKSWKTERKIETGNNLYLILILSASAPHKNCQKMGNTTLLISSSNYVKRHINVCSGGVCVPRF